MKLDRNILKQAKNLKFLSRANKEALINKIPDSALMKVLGKFGKDEDVILCLDEFFKLGSNLDLCKKVHKDDAEAVQKKNLVRAKILVNYLCKKHKRQLIKKEILDYFDD